MPRQARERSDSRIYHLILRGINRQSIFEDDEDRVRFIDTICHFKTISNYELYGYCLMNNHIHLLVKETKDSISMIVKRISSSFVYWYNQKYDRCGHLFQERFKSEAVETDEYFLTVLRYIHQNPIKAGITKDIEKYPWTSYREYTRKHSCIDVDFAFDYFSKERKKGIELFQDFMNERNNDQCLEYKEKIKIPDKEISDYLKKLGAENISELQRFEKLKRDEVITQVKKIEGVTIRQIARVTGIPKSVIDRI